MGVSLIRRSYFKIVIVFVPRSEGGSVMGRSEVRHVPRRREVVEGRVAPSWRGLAAAHGSAAERDPFYEELEGSLEALRGVVGDGDRVAGAKADFLQEVVGKVLWPQLYILEVLEDPLRQFLLLSIRREVLGLQDEHSA